MSEQFLKSINGAQATFGPGGAVSDDITQTDHGLAVGDVVRIGVVPPTLIQQKVGGSTSSTTIVVTLDSTPAAGSCLIACVDNDSGAISGITGGGVTWAQVDHSASHIIADIWVGPNASGAGTTTITITKASGTGGANVSEWAGLQTSPADTHGAANGTNGTPTTAAITPSVALSLVIGAAGGDTAVSGGPTDGFTALTAQTQGAIRLVAAYKVLTAAALISTSWTAGADGWDAVIAAFKGSGDVTDYTKAQADSAADAEAVGIVSAVADADNFTLTTHGVITGMSGLTVGTVYYLDPSTAGALTDTEPSTSGQVSKPLLIARSTTSGYLFNWRGEVLA